MTYVRLVRLFRIVRSARLIRIFRFFSDLRLMLIIAFNSIVPLMWISVFLTIIMFVFAVATLTGVESYIANAYEGEDDQMVTRLAGFFPSLPMALLTFFMA